MSFVLRRDRRAAVNRDVRSPIPVPHPQGNALDREYSLRFRGSTAEVESFTVRGVQPVKLNVGRSHSGFDARCVNRQRPYNHKVPRSRARITLALRASAWTHGSAGSAIELAGFRRCVGGQAQEPAGFHRGPSINAATNGEFSCQGAEAASERLGVRQSNYRLERSIMALMAIKTDDRERRIGAALRVWRSAQPGR